jgi:hypothetical protein
MMAEPAYRNFQMRVWKTLKVTRNDSHFFNISCATFRISERHMSNW